MVELYNLKIGHIVKKVDKLWGKEYWLVNNENYCGKILELKKQYQCSMHCHEEKKETFFVLKGKIALDCCNKMTVYHAGYAVTIEPKQYHSFIGLEDSYILEISTQHKDEDSYRKTSSKKIKEIEFEKLKMILGIDNL